MNRLETLTISLVIVIVGTSLKATIINIPQDYLTIQAGIDASNNGDTVLVQSGTFVENIDFTANQFADIKSRKRAF